jgi:hypothetical protein
LRHRDRHLLRIAVAARSSRDSSVSSILRGLVWGWILGRGDLPCNSICAGSCDCDRGGIHHLPAQVHYVAAHDGSFICAEGQCGQRLAHCDFRLLLRAPTWSAGGCSIGGVLRGLVLSAAAQLGVGGDLPRATVRAGCGNGN